MNNIWIYCEQRRGVAGNTDTIELKLPTKLEYVSVLRAAMGVIFGGRSYDYDEITRFSQAAAEAFKLSSRRVDLGRDSSPRFELTVRFLVQADKIEMLILSPGGYLGDARNGREEETPGCC